MAELSTQIAGIHFRNPVLLASGTCGYGQELEPFIDLTAIGGIVTKTITPIIVGTLIFFPLQSEKQLAVLNIQKLRS